ncbi:MAG TPA: hypothetical protein VF292_12975 [Rhodanobacteraceae bacterium]
MATSVLSHVSALLLGIAGLVLLFASDVVLPGIIAGFPATAAWVGQLLAAAWLGVAVLTWLQRKSILGGIYGRPTVMANLALYFISALSLIAALRGHGAPPVLWLAVAVSGLLAIAYGTLLLRGPFGVADGRAQRSE